MFFVILIVTTINSLVFVHGKCAGHCQSDYGKCGGSYVSNECPGDSHNRCCTNNFVIRDTGFCTEYGVEIVSRDSWGARSPTAKAEIEKPVRDFFIHHTDTPSCSSTTACAIRMKSIQNYHMDYKKWSDIGYSFLVGEDGRIYEGRGWGIVGAHTKGYNKVSLAASFIGNFTLVKPNYAALNAVKMLINCGVKKGKISTDYAIFGHRDVGNTTCPGNALYHIIQKWPRYKFHKP